MLCVAIVARGNSGGAATDATGRGMGATNSGDSTGAIAKRS
jgi:hypothetical protein